MNDPGLAGGCAAWITAALAMLVQSGFAVDRGPAKTAWGPWQGVYWSSFRFAFRFPPLVRSISSGTDTRVTPRPYRRRPFSVS